MHGKISSERGMVRRKNKCFLVTVQAAAKIIWAGIGVSKVQEVQNTMSGMLIPNPNECPFCYLDRGGEPGQAARLIYLPCSFHKVKVSIIFDGQEWPCTGATLITLAENILFRRRSRLLSKANKRKAAKESR